MKVLVTTAAMLTMLVVAQPATAQITCSDIEYSDDILDRYPLVADACQGIIEQGGENFVVLRARVSRMNDESIVLEYMHADGIWGPYVEVTPPEDYEVRIGGLPTPWQDLTARQEMNIYLPEGRWALAMVDIEETEFVEPTIVPIMHAVSPEPKEEIVETTAERTAAPAPEPAPAEPVGEDSPMIWFVLIGLLAVIALVIMARRREA